MISPPEVVQIRHTDPSLRAPPEPALSLETRRDETSFEKGAWSPGHVPKWVWGLDERESERLNRGTQRRRKAPQSARPPRVCWEFRKGVCLVAWSRTLSDSAPSPMAKNASQVWSVRIFGTPSIVLETELELGC